MKYSSNTKILANGSRKDSVIVKNIYLYGTIKETLFASADITRLSLMEQFREMGYRYLFFSFFHFWHPPCAKGRGNIITLFHAVCLFISMLRNRGI